MQAACCLVDVNGRTASGVEEVEALVAAAASAAEGGEEQGAQLVDVDHVFGDAGAVQGM